MEKKLAEESKRNIAAQFPDKTIVTPILEASVFYPIRGEESHHQDYYKKNPLRYKYYRWNCGRDQRLRRIWGDKAIH
jgi:peptide-methionine (S)-S-oxide reductase